jgi:hypothetical protein
MHVGKWTRKERRIHYGMKLMRKETVAKHVMFTCARMDATILFFVIKLPFQWYKKFQLNICYISSSLIQIIKCPDDIMKKCILKLKFR